MSPLDQVCKMSTITFVWQNEITPDFTILGTVPEISPMTMIIPLESNDKFGH